MYSGFSNTSWETVFKQLINQSEYRSLLGIPIYEFIDLEYNRALRFFGILIVVKPKAKLIITSLVGAAVLQGMIAIAQFGLQWTPAFKWLGLASQSAWELGPGIVETLGGRWLRSYGSLPHPNILGGFLCAGLLGVIYLLSIIRKKGRWWLWLSLVLVAQGLVLSFSRSAWLGLVFGAMLLLVKPYLT